MELYPFVRGREGKLGKRLGKGKPAVGEVEGKGKGNPVDGRIEPQGNRVGEGILHLVPIRKAAGTLQVQASGKMEGFPFSDIGKILSYSGRQ